MDQIISEVLRPFGALRNYHGFYQLIVAIEIILKNPSRLTYITSVYMDVAEQCHCNACTVERNLRTLIHCMWKRNQIYMKELAGSSLSKAPTVSQFLDIITLHIQKKYPDHIYEVQKEY